MEHQNLLFYETTQELETDYPNGMVDNPDPGVAYARNNGDDFYVTFNRKVTRYELTVHFEDRSGTTLEEDTAIQSPPVLIGNSVKVTVAAPEIEGYKPIYEKKKIEIEGDDEYTVLYLAATSYTITVNHMFSGESIACATTIDVDNIYEEDVVSVTIEPLNIEGYVAEPVTIRVSGDMEYYLEYEEASLCYVDLGLPSGTLWACANIGASSPEEVGNIYAWGELETKSYYDLSNYRFYSSTHFRECSSNYTKYNECDGLENLELADDVANVELGGDWHIATEEQWFELLDNTTLDYESIRGCVVLTSNINGNSIILPIYTYNTSPEATENNCVSWTNSFDQNSYVADANAFLSHLGCESAIGPESVSRYFGAPIRPVIGVGPQTPVIPEIPEPLTPVDR